MHLDLKVKYFPINDLIVVKINENFDIEQQQCVGKNKK